MGVSSSYIRKCRLIPEKYEIRLPVGVARRVSHCVIFTAVLGLIEEAPFKLNLVYGENQMVLLR
jgi:hypothetical protein